MIGVGVHPFWVRNVFGGGPRVSVEIPGNGTAIITITFVPRVNVQIPGDGTAVVEVS